MKIMALGLILATIYSDMGFIAAMRECIMSIIARHKRHKHILEILWMYCKSTAADLGFKASVYVYKHWFLEKIAIHSSFVYKIGVLVLLVSMYVYTVKAFIGAAKEAKNIIDAYYLMKRFKISSNFKEICNGDSYKEVRDHNYRCAFVAYFNDG